MKHLPLFLTTLFALLLFAPPLLAGDEEAEDSQAARLFREAWWQETGAGRLDEAVAGYEKALAAEGSEGVRARALYRMAVVLQRMGRTEEGVRALERLTRDFASQPELLAQARARLEEWTAEDLRGSFGEWYQRYKYSPAFQAQIVERILKLGTGDPKVRAGMEQELLTIGEPALPALRQHSTSANLELRDAAVVLMGKLGALPPAEALLQTERWFRVKEVWQVLHEAQGEEREALRRAMEGRDEKQARWIRALLDGPDAYLGVLADETRDPRDAAYGFLYAFPAADLARPVLERTRALVQDETVHVEVRKRLGAMLLYTHDLSSPEPHPAGLTVEEVLAWTGSEQEEVRRLAWDHLRYGRLRSPDAWRFAAQALAAVQATRAEPGATGAISWSPKEAQGISGALLAALRLADPGADFERAVTALATYVERAGTHRVDTLMLQPKTDLPGDRAVPLHVLAQAIGRARGSNAGRGPEWWWKLGPQDEAAVRQLVRWAASAAELLVRRSAALLAAQHLRSGVADLLDATEDERRRVELRDDLLNGFWSNEALESLDWSVASLARLVRTADTKQRSRSGQAYSSGTYSWPGGRALIASTLGTGGAVVFHRLLQSEPLREQILDVALADPEGFPPDLWLHLGAEWGEVEANREHVLERVREAWGGWTPAQRRAALPLFLSRWLVGSGAGGAVDAFARHALDLGPHDRELTIELFRWLAKPTLDELRKVYDLSDPEQVQAATDLLGTLPHTEEVYDAFVSVLAGDADEEVKYAFWSHFRGAPASRRDDLIRRMLRQEEERLAQAGMELLAARNAPEDIPLWIAALGHGAPGVRMAAAGKLGSMYDQAAIRALAKAVDDPVPGVRDAVLAALTKIEEIEKKKAYWRKFGEGR